MKRSSLNDFTRSTVFTPAQALAPLRISPRELAPHNQALLQFVRQYQGITAAQVFTDYKDAGMAMEVLLKRVTYLVNKRWLLKAGKGPAAVLTFNAARTPTPPTPAQARSTPAPRQIADPLRMAQPRQFVSSCPLYQPTPAQAQRAGSNDHASLPSLRNGQRVPYVPGYIFY